jgi:hypothetical protein
MRHKSRICHPLQYTVALVVLIFSFQLITTQIAHGQTPSTPSSQTSDQRVASPALPTAWSDGVKALAAKIAAAAKPARAISLEIKNISSLDAVDVEAIRKGLEAELTNRGLRAGSSRVAVEVTLSENVNGFVWVAEIGESGKKRMELIQVTKANVFSPSIKPIPLLQRKIVWRQKTQFLDFSIRTFSPELLDINYTTIFEFGAVRTFEFRVDRWSETRNTSIPLVSGARDPRGLFVPGDDGRAYVGEEACLKLFLDQYCGESPRQDWPLPSGIYGRFVGNRNYFAGFAKDGTDRLERQPFYTVAIGINIFDHSTPIITTELDSKARLYNDTQASEAAFGDWGDDIASIKPSCGAGWQVLVTGTGDWTESDRIQVYGISFGNNSAAAKPEGQPLEFPGPIVAIWQADDERSARVISKNLQTGMYEASIVTLNCSQ